MLGYLEIVFMKYRKLLKPLICVGIAICVLASDSTVSNAVRSVSEIVL